MRKKQNTPYNASPNPDAMTIFISIASYCDSLLRPTIEDALAKAAYPERLRFGVVEQTDLEERLPVAEMQQSKQIRYLGIDRLHSRGVGWARNVAMSLYQEEDWFFQIDSHMIFKFGWDVKLLESAEECAAINPQFVISSYPNPFNFIDGEPTPQPVTNKILAHVLKKESEFGEFLTLAFSAIGLDYDAPLKGYHLGAGCLFAPGKFVSAFPYDAQIYFEGEEQALAARLFTHGWDIFHVAGLPIYHLYQHAGSPTRPKHWNQEENEARTQKWYELSSHAKHRVTSILLGQRDHGIYGLGDQRTMEEYAAFCGIDYHQKTVSELAKTGPWVLNTQDPLTMIRPNRTINIVETNPFAPRPFVYSDVAYYLLNALQANGMPARLSHNPVDDDGQINIIIGVGDAVMKTVNQLTSKHNIIFNVERLEQNSNIVNEAYLNWLKNQIVFDANSANVAYLKGVNGSSQVAFEIPLATSEAMSYFPEMPNTGGVDVLFFGSMSGRRAVVIENLRNSGLNVEVVSGAYGRELTPAIKRAKLILHVHHSENTTFPFMRFMQAIPCGIPILCENSTMSASSDWRSSGITFAPYDKLVEAVHEKLAKDPKELSLAANKIVKFSTTIKPEDTIKKVITDLGWYSEES